MQYVDVATVELHADTAFSAHERSLLRQASARIEAETAGHVRVALTYDFDWGSMASIRRLATENAILRTDSASARFLGPELGSQEKRLGYTDKGAPLRVYLLVDRLRSDRLFVHVAMHELLHAAGAGHVEHRGALMHPSTDGRAPPLGLNDADRRELCRFVGCR